MDLVKALEDRYKKPEIPEMNIGDTVRVSVKVKEGKSERIKAFVGTINANKHGGINERLLCAASLTMSGERFPHPLAHHQLDSGATRGKVPC